ncbi:uncharacterized protein [Elaeis guineensis]|uniref:Uncharacterized protein LOC105061336 isoform X2 n=1 Tax=Elaeis guineensis var. tenera TaxID=51953 RepID=A0A6I9SHZ3_ELAGV|nr:uncharacterized protein LOC105061336 isoform X2 [Elaeis guineensis]
MDFHSLSRRQLQALCKRNRIPANTTNIAMADALQALQTVEGVDEIQEALQFQSPSKAEEVSQKLPRSSRRTSARRGSMSLCRACPGCAGASEYSMVKKRAMEEEEREKQESPPEIPETPSASGHRKTRASGTPGTRRRAAKKEKIKRLESLFDAPETPFAPSPRTTSTLQLLGTPVEQEEKAAPLRSYKRRRSSCLRKQREEEIDSTPQNSKRSEVLVKMAPLAQEHAEDEDFRDLTDVVASKAISGEKASTKLLFDLTTTSFQPCPRDTVKLKEEFGGNVNAVVASKDINEGASLITEGIKKCQNETTGEVNFLGSGSNVTNPKAEGQNSELRSVVELHQNFRKASKERDQQHDLQLTNLDCSPMRGLVECEGTKRRTMEDGRTNSDDRRQDFSCQLPANGATEKESNQFSCEFPASCPPSIILNCKANGDSSEPKANQELVAASGQLLLKGTRNSLDLEANPDVYWEFPAIDYNSCDDPGQFPATGYQIRPASELLDNIRSNDPKSKPCSVDVRVESSSKLLASNHQTPATSETPCLDDQKGSTDVAVPKIEFSGETMDPLNQIPLESVGPDGRCELDGNGDETNLDQCDILKHNINSSNQQAIAETSCAVSKFSGEIPATLGFDGCEDVTGEISIGRNPESDSIPETASSSCLQIALPCSILQSSLSTESPAMIHSGMRDLIGNLQYPPPNPGMQSPQATRSPAKISIKVGNPLDVTESEARIPANGIEQKISLSDPSLNTLVATIPTKAGKLIEKLPEINSSADKFHDIGAGLVELEGGSKEVKWRHEPINTCREEGIAARAQTKAEKHSVKEDLDSLSMRKLKMLYKKRRKRMSLTSLTVDERKEENEVKIEEGEQTNQKSYLNGLSLRKLRTMCKVAAKNNGKILREDKVNKPNRRPI